MVGRYDQRNAPVGRRGLGNARAAAGPRLDAIERTLDRCRVDTRTRRRNRALTAQDIFESVPAPTTLGCRDFLTTPTARAASLTPELRTRAGVLFSPCPTAIEQRRRRGSRSRVAVGDRVATRRRSALSLEAGGAMPTAAADIQPGTSPDPRHPHRRASEQRIHAVGGWLYGPGHRYLEWPEEYRFCLGSLLRVQMSTACVPNRYRPRNRECV